MAKLLFLCISSMALCHLINATAMEKLPPPLVLRRSKRSEAADEGPGGGTINSDRSGVSDDALSSPPIANASMIANDFGRLHTDGPDSSPKRNSKADAVNKTTKDKKQTDQPPTSEAYKQLTHVAATKEAAAKAAAAATGPTTAHSGGFQSNVHTPTSANKVRPPKQQTSSLASADSAASDKTPAHHAYAQQAATDADSVIPLFDDLVGERENDDFATLDISVGDAGETAAKHMRDTMRPSHGDRREYGRQRYDDGNQLVNSGECNVPPRDNANAPSLAIGNTNQAFMRPANNNNNRWNNINNQLPTPAKPTVQVWRAPGGATGSGKFSPMDDFMHFANMLLYKVGLEKPQFHATAQVLRNPNFSSNNNSPNKNNNNGNGNVVINGEMDDLDGLDYLYNTIDGPTMHSGSASGGIMRPYNYPPATSVTLSGVDASQPINLLESALDILLSESENGGIGAEAGADDELELRCPVHRMMTENGSGGSDSRGAAAGVRDDLIQLCSCRLIKKKAKK